MDLFHFNVVMSFAPGGKSVAVNITAVTEETVLEIVLVGLSGARRRLDVVWYYAMGMDVG